MRGTTGGRNLWNHISVAAHPVVSHLADWIFPIILCSLLSPLQIHRELALWCKWPPTLAANNPVSRYELLNKALENNQIYPLIQPWNPSSCFISLKHIHHRSISLSLIPRRPNALPIHTWPCLKTRLCIFNLHTRPSPGTESPKQPFNQCHLAFFLCHTFNKRLWRIQRARGGGRKRQNT